MTMKLSRNIFLRASLSAVLALPLFLLPARASAGKETIATLNGEPITREQVEQRTATKLYRLRWEIYDTLKTEAEKLVDERLLAEEAKRRGVSVEELLHVEVEQGMQPATDEQIDAYIEEQQISDKPDEEVRARIATYLTERAKIQKKLDFLEELRKKSDYRFLLEPPERPRVRVSVDDDPVRGSPDAPVTIIHFASLSCDHCAESARKIKRLTEEFPGLIRWVHRDFLNPFDERGLKAAEAGETAHAQGKFWEFHDYVYSLHGDFAPEDLGKMLEAVGVDASQYEQALKDARYILEIKHDIEDGVQAGVTGVPTIFINGRYTSGTFPYEQLKQMVEEELQAASPKAEKEAESLP